MREAMQQFFMFLAVLIASGFITGGLGAAERAKPVKIGALTESWGPTPHVAGLREGLKQLGYREDKDFVIGVRFTQGDTAALPQAARELIEMGIDILFAAGPNSANAARMASKRIPIVFAEVPDPLGSGLIQSFARPGGNATGITDLNLELGPKRLEIFSEMIQGLKRVLFPYNANDSYGVAETKVYRDEARRLGLVLVEKPVHSEEEAQALLAHVRKSDMHGILAPRSISLNIPGFVVEATARRGVPAMFSTTFWPENGGLAAYGAALYESGRRAARLVDKILKGVKPAEIPVEVNERMELIINIKVAKAVGIKIAPEVLYRANRVIR
ncbi:MAG: ABC transporter substrate-binding protein [Deltaproteobacteria bacterium]|nr:ABC transporter substrate-binding protein [Deltaproteobacteria bacterium]